MSVSREVVAKVAGVSVEQCNCQHCARHSPFINDMLWCIGFSGRTKSTDFCSFFLKEDDQDQEQAY